MKPFLSLQRLKQIPILGFNSGKYDMTFIISHMKDQKIRNLITKASSYMKLTYGRWNFLDVRNFALAGTNLNRFANMWGVKNQKVMNSLTA